MKEYAAYKGDQLIGIGTAQEIADRMGVKKSTVQFYTTPTYKKRVAKRKRAKNYITVEKLGDELDA